MRLARRFATAAASVEKNVVVYGGAGALGQAVVKSFRARGGWKTHSIDLKECPISDTSSSKFDECLFKDKPDTIVCVAGGWVGGDVSDPDVFQKLDKMMTVNLKPSLQAAHVARCLKPGGLLVLTGAAPVFKGDSSGMVAYGIAKAGVHQLVKSISLSNGAKTICILPHTIDTPANREGMPKADYDSWTRPEVIASCIVRWSEGSVGVPPIEDNGFYEFRVTQSHDVIRDLVNGVQVNARPAKGTSGYEAR